MLIYTLYNPKTGESFSVAVGNEKEETEIRNLAAICGWEIKSIEEG